MARILAIDFGGKRTGIATTDPLQIIASALETVATTDLEEFLTDYCRREEVEAIIVGAPTYSDGTPTPLEEKIQLFLTAFAKVFPEIQIHRVDEGFSSQAARSVIFQSGTKRKKRQDKGLVDRVSATLLLQTFLGHHDY